MPLPLPNLDDRDYAEIVEVARSLIPTEAPDWTDHNPSDTGIVLLELLAWLTELLLYRVDQIPDRSQEAFLRLLNGPDWPRDEASSLQAATRQTILALRERYRAATSDDFEQLVLHYWPQTDEAQQLAQQRREQGKQPETVARAKLFSQLDLSTANAAQKSGHLSLVVIPTGPVDLRQIDDPPDPPPLPHPSDALKRSIWRYFDPRRLLTTQHHVVGPTYKTIQIAATLYLQEGRAKPEVLTQARRQLWRFSHPLVGGETGTGWPFGRDVYVSEIYQQLDQLPDVDYVQAVEFTNQPQTSTITLQPHELVELDLAATTLTLRGYWEDDTEEADHG